MTFPDEEDWNNLQRGSAILFGAAQAQSGCYLTVDQTAALAGALLHLTHVASHLAMAERN